MTPARTALGGIVAGVVALVLGGSVIGATLVADAHVTRETHTVERAEHPADATRDARVLSPEDGYLEALAYTYPSFAAEPVTALGAGYEVCWGLDGTGDADAWLSGQFDAAEQPDRFLSVVAAATSNLCPDHEDVGHAFVNGGWRS